MIRRRQRPYRATHPLGCARPSCRPNAASSRAAFGILPHGYGSAIRGGVGSHDRSSPVAARRPGWDQCNPRTCSDKAEGHGSGVL